MNKILCVFVALSFIVDSSSAQQKRNTTPFVLGETDTIQSAELKETRKINIYLPEGYSQDSATLYPVIYLLDGSADEDFIHIAGLVQFANFPWIDLLPKSIVVGIANIDRRRDFTYPTTIEKDKKDFPTTGSSAKFIAFIEKELQPFVQRNYKTSSIKTIIGQSLGGLLATEILFTKPSLFSKYIIVSPSLWWDNESLLTKKTATIDQPTTVFIAVGKEGAVMEGDAHKLNDLLLAKNNKNITVNFDYFAGENHASILHWAVYKAFEIFAKNKKN